MGELVFLGTGSAWRAPEHNCDCVICSTMRSRGEERTRSSILVESSVRILIDCGPDLLTQMKTNSVKRPDVVLITHEHGDHFLGLDELLAFKRSVPGHLWRPIPVYASEETWKAIQTRFFYLVGSVIDKKIAVPGEQIELSGAFITPFKTNHGRSAPGSLGYVLESLNSGASTKIVYTSDFFDLPEEPDFIRTPDILLMQSHWLNEPDENKPFHMSLARGIDFIRRWNPIGTVYLLHLSASDVVDGDPCNDRPKKPACSRRLTGPSNGEPYRTPCCQSDWESVVRKITTDFGIGCKMEVAYDGLRVRF